MKQIVNQVNGIHFGIIIQIGLFIGVELGPIQMEFQRQTNKKSATSLNSTYSVENMREVKVRSSLTARGYLAFGPWNDSSLIYSLAQINLGNNPNSKLEVVSTLNITNYSMLLYWYNEPYAVKKYNPKVYMSTIQSVAYGWNWDTQTGQTNGLQNLVPDVEKSGS